MKTKLTHKLTALAFITFLQFSGYALAQDESPFDTIERGSSEAARTLANPAAETAPRLSPRMQMAPRVAPEAMIQNPQSRMVVPDTTVLPGTEGTELRTEPQAIVTDPYANPYANPYADRNIEGAYVEPVIGAEAYVAPRVMPELPSTCGFLPKLGFHGRLIPGVGMQVVSVNFGGVAHREGLETGDIIVEINGRRIMHEFDYERALVDAAVYSYGQVSLLVRNIRFQPGCHLNPAFVRVYSQLPMRHVVGYPYGVVAAR